MPKHTSKPHERIAEIKRQADAGPAILNYCFRPFFLGAGIWGTLALPFWLLSYSGYLALPNAFEDLLWHQHEMLFGFASAAIAGFMLTTIPNWTGHLPVSGWRLALFVAVWLAGRMAMLSVPLIGPISATLLDLAFLTTLCIVIAREIISGKNWRNLPMLLLISLFTTGNWLVHAEILGLTETADLGIRLSTYILAILVAVIGGRIVPSFTRNWLVKQKSDVRPEPAGLIDKIALGALILFVFTQILIPDHILPSILALLASGLHLIRLFRWKGWAVFGEPIMWVQHLGYAWLVFALLLTGLSGLTDYIPASAALHALTTGAFGTMILGVMARASFTFTGRTLKATKGITSIFVAITIAALVRIAAPFLPDLYVNLLWISGFFWMLAYGLFTVLFFPILTGPRLKRSAS